MQGTRIYPDAGGNYPFDKLDAGTYFYWPRGACWMGVTPNGLTAGLKSYTVVEHEDKTITVSPAIMVSGGEDKTWHGVLERGVWREC